MGCAGAGGVLRGRRDVRSRRVSDCAPNWQRRPRESWGEDNGAGARPVSLDFAPRLAAAISHRGRPRNPEQAWIMPVNHAEINYKLRINCCTITRITRLRLRFYWSWAVTFYSPGRPLFLLKIQASFTYYTLQAAISFLIYLLSYVNT